MYCLLFKTFWWKMSKIRQTVLEILMERWFLRVKCRHYGKITIFRIWLLGSLYDSPCSLYFMQKSEKSKKQILRNVRKTIFLDCHLVYFWTRPSMNASFIALFLSKLVALIISVNYLTHFDEKWAKTVKPFLRYWRKGDFCA